MTCRGCSGTCCTGVGSEPCTCETREASDSNGPLDLDSEENLDAFQQLLEALEEFHRGLHPQDAEMFIRGFRWAELVDHLVERFYFVAKEDVQ